MIKTLKQVLKSDKESLKVPTSVQDTIPVKRVWPDGTFQTGSKFSKTFKFSDINYSVASKDDQMAMFLDYCELLNSSGSRCNNENYYQQQKAQQDELPSESSYDAG